MQNFSSFILNKFKTKPNKVILTVMAKVMGTPKKTKAEFSNKLKGKNF